MKFALIGADTNTRRAEAKAAGFNMAFVDTYWDRLQPSGTGSVDSGEITAIKGAIADCQSKSMGIIFTLNLQYPPAWVLSGVEKFKDQTNVEFDLTDTANGEAVRNWMFTSTGRAYVLDVVTRLTNALTVAERAAVDSIRLGGGSLGELHVPAKDSDSAVDMAWQAYSTSLQAGTGIATGLSACPNPGFIPFAGGTTDADNSEFLNWYLNLNTNWMEWQINTWRSLGWACRLHILLPGHGIRFNQTRATVGYQVAAARMESHYRNIGAMAKYPGVYPYTTWINKAGEWEDGASGIDSDMAAWKSVRNKAAMWNLHRHLAGENTGGETTGQIDDIFAGPLSNNAFAGVEPSPYGSHYEMFCFLNYTNAIADSGAIMDHLQTKIAAVNG